MSSRSDKVKSIVKRAAPKETFGTNPNDPWSTKANIAEDASLDKYLLSRGINPQFATKDQKVAHSKTGQFIKWKKDHMLESVDEKDMVCFDIPLLIRVLEFTREEMKTDIELHNMVERLINMRHDVPLDMSHYDDITEKLVKENHIAIAMGKMLDDEGSMVLNQLDDIDRCSKMIRDYIGKDYEKQLPAWVQSKVTLAADYINTVGTYLMSKNEEVEHIDEISKELTHSYFKKSIQDKSKENRKQRMAGQGRAIRRLTNKLELPKGIDPSEGGKYTADSVEHDGTPMLEAQSAALRFQKALQREKAKREEQERKDAESKARAEKLLNPPKTNEDVYQDPKAATQTVFDGANNTDDTMKSARSKSARIIKSIYKKKGVTEEIYDHEKEDKSVATYGKKPSVKETNAKSQGENPDKAAIIMKGGTTLTGTGRDTVEIDPEMKRPKGGTAGGPQDTKTINR